MMSIFLVTPRAILKSIDLRAAQRCDSKFSG
ncbi:hypothetical protein EMIT0158MI4_180069 [Burkholderia ambifaria]